MLNRTMNVIVMMAIVALFMPVASGTVVTQDVEIRGQVATTDITYDYANFGAFWFDLKKNHSSEVMTVNVTGRDIAEEDLVYTCTPRMIKYKNPDLNTTYGKYKIMGFMAEKYICYDNKTDQLVKLLINQKSSVKKMLTTGDSMEFAEGYMLDAQEIDLEGDKVFLRLYKDGKEIDASVVLGGDTYTYEDEDDVLLFSCLIDSVFRGTESNMVVVKYVFLRSADIIDVKTGDTFGVMKVKSTSGSIVLKSDETLTLDKDDEVEIMDGLYFKVADASSLRYYLAKRVSLVCPESPECPECPELGEYPPCPDCPDCPECPEPKTVIEYRNVTMPANKPVSDSPGFPAAIAIAGVLGIVYLGVRKRKG